MESIKKGLRKQGLTAMDAEQNPPHAPHRRFAPDKPGSCAASDAGVRAAGAIPTQGKTLELMQISGRSQSFNTVNQLRVLGRWMRMLTIPKQSSVAKAFLEFDEAGRMKPSSYDDRVVDVMEGLVKFTLLKRDVSPYLVKRYSELRESAKALSRRVI